MHPPLLRKDLDEIQERLQAAEKLSLFLDFDGTLTPIVPDRSQAKLAESVRQTLSCLSRREDVLTAVISGRALADLRARIDLADVVYAGNHGLEISGRTLSFVEPVAAAIRPTLQRLTESLSARLEHIDGAAVEYKGLTTSIHYRRAAPAHVPEIKSAVHAVVDPHAALFRLADGKMVFEILPRTTWHKGAAARWINERLGDGAALTVYIGDDLTDEDAFAALPDAVTIRVGKDRKTQARYHLGSPSDVHDFLFWLSRSWRP